MNQRKRIRRVGLLCVHCLKNVAYYRSGWTNGSFVSQNDFWVCMNGNFLNIAVLEWCKLFAEWNGKHHWRKVVMGPENFLNSLHAGTGITEDEFDAHRDKNRSYRNKFVAHLDEELVMHIPALDLTISSVVFLYNTIRGEFQHFLQDAPVDIEAYYEERVQHGRQFYPRAT